ncbi:hypothetical protein ACB092_01G060200 [Castanea dentata]
MNCDGYEKSHISVGPWGGQCGGRWDDGVYCTIRQLIISHGAVIDSIQIEYDTRGSSVWSEKHGGSGGTKTDKIKLDYPDEHLISISGHFGSIIEWGPLIVRSLVLESNRKRYGPFGIQQGTPFTFPVTGGKVVGFHGRSSFYIDSIGVYLKPLLQHNNGINEKSKGYDILVAVREKMGNMLFENVDNKVYTTTEASKGSSYIRQTAALKEDHAFQPNRPFTEFETNERVFFTTEGEKASSNMRHARREKEDYSFVSNNQVFNNVETMDKVFINAEAEKASSKMRQARREKEDFSFVSNNQVFNNVETTDKVFSTAQAAKGYSNMRHNEDKMLIPNKVFGEFETKDKVYTTAQIAKGSKSVRQAVSYGPWGGNGGMLFDDGLYTGVREIHVTRSGGLVSIRVCYDLNGQAIWGDKNGGNGGLRLDKITFDYPREFLTNISGYHGSMILRGPTVVKSITFYTNKKKYGPFGDEQGVPFSSGSIDGIIVGFHGRKGWFVESIGVHVLEGKLSLPRPSYDVFNKTDIRISEVQGLAPCGPGVLPAGMVKEPAPYGPGPWGGDGGKPWDDGVFSGVKKIFLTRGEAIYSIQFEYDRNGQSMWSVKHGANKEGTCHVVQFEYPQETLSCISGYYGSVAGDECKKAIKSLTFYTNRGRYGPYGEETGTYFTSTKTEGKIVGFHGRAACYLYAIGVHMQHWSTGRVEQGTIKTLLNKIFT